MSRQSIYFKFTNKSEVNVGVLDCFVMLVVILGVIKVLFQSYCVFSKQFTNRSEVNGVLDCFVMLVLMLSVITV